MRELRPVLSDVRSQTVESRISRRKMLGGLVLAAAGATVGPTLGRLQVAGAAAATKTIVGNTGGALPPFFSHLQSQGYQVAFGPILAPDGFPQASIQGTFVGVNGPYCMVNARESIVAVTTLPNSEVLSGGYLANGSLAELSVGDRLFIFTTVTESGERVAIRIEQNPRIYDLTVSAISGSNISGITLPSDQTPGVPLVLTVNNLTNFQPPSVPQVGSRIRVATIANAPWNAAEIVAMNVNMLSVS